MSKSTLISIVPFPISEFKPGIYPGNFELKASKDNIPEVLVIGESVYHVELDENRTITVKCTSEDIAKSVVDDCIISTLAYSAEDEAVPGFFWKPGEHSSRDIINKFAGELEYYIKTQTRWFSKLVQLADDDWEKSRQHKFISDIQRYAAKALGLERPWIIVTKVANEGQIKCPACQVSINSEAIVCQNCRCIINMDKYKTLQFIEVK